MAALAAAGLACADGLEPVSFQGISGAVEYRGAVPDSTEWIRVGAFLEVPNTITDFLSFSAISDTLPLSVDTSTYLLALEANVYRWLPVVWKQQNVTIPDGLRVLGWYTGTADPFGDPRAFFVRVDSVTEGIDIAADFSNPLTLEKALEALR